MNFTPAPERTWAIWKWSAGQVASAADSVDDWTASPILGWSAEGYPIYWDGEALAEIHPETPNLWTIVLDACLPSALEAARRAVAYAKTGSYQLDTDPPEPVLGEEAKAA